MPMTREMKKKFIELEDRLSKLEKPDLTKIIEVNGVSPGDLESRLETIEMVLQIPGEVDGEIHVMSAWRQIIESKIQNIETVLVIPGPKEFLSGFAAKVDEVLTTLKERLTTLESTAHTTRTPTDRQLESLKERVRGSEAQRHKVLNLIQRVGHLEQKPIAGALSQVTGKMVEDIREHELELFGSDGTGDGLKARIVELTKTVVLLRRAVGFIMGPLLILLILMRLLTLIF